MAMKLSSCKGRTLESLAVTGALAFAGGFCQIYGAEQLML